MDKKILYLTLKKQWFDMILSGEKQEEYRQIKPYWEKRLDGKKFDIVRFRNGYHPDCPEMDVELIGVYKSLGKPQWGAPKDRKVFILILGKVLRIKIGDWETFNREDYQMIVNRKATGVLYQEDV